MEYPPAPFLPVQPPTRELTTLSPLPNYGFTPATDVYGVSGSNVIGFANNVYNTVSFVYNNGNYSTLSAFGAVLAPSAISGNNIVGSYGTQYGNQIITYGFLYNGTNYTSLSAFNGLVTSPKAISGNNIIGNYENSNGSAYYGFMYNGSTYTKLDPFGANYASASGVYGNNVVGVYQINSYSSISGYLYNGSKYTSLVAFGLTDTEPTATSGNYIVSTNNSSGGFLYDILTNTYTQINVPGSYQTIVTSIDGNNIGGYYTYSNVRSFGFEYTISPVPEPSGFALLGMATIMFAGYYGWRRWKLVAA